MGIPNDHSDAPASGVKLVIQNSEVDEQTRAQLREIGLDPDRFVTQMQALERAAEAKAERSA